MKILCNNYINGFEEQPGDQPIRVFYPRLKNAFGNIVNEMSISHSQNLSELRFSFLTENIQAIGPSCTLSQVEVHDTFLSMLWGFCYGFLIKAPIRNDYVKEENELAGKLFDYSQSLLIKYTEWDKLNLPNPELHDRDPKYFIGKTNMTFWYAYNFILYHEFAHIILGHFDSRSDLPKLEKEFEADKFAAERILEKVNSNPQEMSGKIGILSALNSILFCTYNIKGGRLHPDPNNRLEAVLNLIDDSKSNRGIWGLATYIIIEWGMKFNAYFKLWPGTYKGDMKDAFKQSMNHLKHLQEEREVVVPNMESSYNINERVVHLENSVEVVIKDNFRESNSNRYTYIVEFNSGDQIIVSSEDIARKYSPMEIQAKKWKEEMKKRNEKSLSIGLDDTNNFVCFYHTSEHYKIKTENPNVRFKWAWGQPSYIK